MNANPIDRRRTFAIISHPDAGKTTLTEKLLLFGGAIQLAGEVRAKANRRQTRSDWMNIERQRGISVVTSVMTFEYGDHVYNLLDTPGHEDFSEDTYRTLTAVDSAVMVIDAARGIEARTRKLFEVCRLRDIPIITFVNKMDRESRDPFDLLDEIEKTLALDTTALTWPIGRGRDFAGTYDLRRNTLRRLDADASEIKVSGPRDPQIASVSSERVAEEAAGEIELVRTGKPIALNAPQFFFAQERSVADEAYAGDVVGIPNHGTLRIGDTLTEGENIVFRGVPSFAPEILRRVKLGDAMKAKKLREALQQMAEEGVVQLFLPSDGSGAIVGVVGALQLDVLAERLKVEYGLPVSFEPSRFEVCRWIEAEPGELDKFQRAYPSSIAVDLDGAPVFMAQSAFNLRYEQERWPAITFNEIKDYQVAGD